VYVTQVIRRLRWPAEIEPPNTELMQKLCGILDVNTFELRSPSALDGFLLRGLYIEATLMAHDCRGNTHLTVDDNFQLTVYASVAIKQNEPILFNYTSSLLVSNYINMMKLICCFFFADISILFEDSI